jgi:hypothetical protein
MLRSKGRNPGNLLLGTNGTWNSAGVLVQSRLRVRLQDLELK